MSCFVTFFVRSQLNKCMAEFMNGKLDFANLSRIKRINCTKVKVNNIFLFLKFLMLIMLILQILRSLMEKKMSDLLSFELDKSLNQIQDDEDASVDLRDGST